MMAFEAEASSTSLSLMAPTPARSTRIRTFSFDSFCIMSLSTSAVPPTSVFRMMLSSLTSPSFNCSCSCSSVTRPVLDMATSRALASR